MSEIIDPHHNGSVRWKWLDGKLYQQAVGQSKWVEVKRLHPTPQRIAALAQGLPNPPEPTNMTDQHDKLRALPTYMPRIQPNPKTGKWDYEGMAKHAMGEYVRVADVRAILSARDAALPVGGDRIRPVDCNGYGSGCHGMDCPICDGAGRVWDATPPKPEQPASDRDPTETLEFGDYADLPEQPAPSVSEEGCEHSVTEGDCGYCWKPAPVSEPAASGEGPRMLSEPEKQSLREFAASVTVEAVRIEVAQFTHPADSLCHPETCCHADYSLLVDGESFTDGSFKHCFVVGHRLRALLEARRLTATGQGDVGWQPIDTVPDTGIVLAYSPVGGGSVSVESARHVDYLRRMAIKDGDQCVYSHWMPRPAAPFGQQQEGQG